MAFDPVALGASPVSSSAAPTAEFNPASYGATQVNSGSAPILNTPAPTPAPALPGGSPLIPATGNENPLVAPIKTLANIPSSALNFGKGILNSLNPVKIAQTISQIFQPNDNPDAPKVSVSDVLKEVPGSIYKTLVPQVLQHLISGNTTGALSDVENDPVGQIAPFLFGAEGVAKGLDAVSGGLEEQARRNVSGMSDPTSPTYGKNIMPTKGVNETGFDNFMGKVTAPVTDTIGNVASKGVDLVGGVAKSAASYITGLDPTTVAKIVSDPEAFSKVAMDNTTRGDLAGEVKTAIDQRLSDLSSTGKGYENIRNMDGAVTVPPTIISDVLAQHGIELVDGKVKVGPESIPLSPADVNALQHFVDTYGNEKTLSNNAFLNTRSALSNMAKYDVGKTNNIQTVARSLRGAYDAVGKAQVPGLKELDSVYAPETQFLKGIKKDYLNKDGTFKDGAVNKIANATGVGKDNLLGRLENVMPGITKRIQILKAVEDIEKAKGIKVGTYGRIVAGGAGLLIHGIPGAIIAEIITSPTIAVPLLRGLGYTTAQLLPVLASLKIIAGDGGSLPKGVSEKIGATLQDLQDKKVATETAAQQAADLAAKQVADAVEAKAKINTGDHYSAPSELPTIQMGKASPTKLDLPVVDSAPNLNLKVKEKVTPPEPYIPADKLPTIDYGRKPVKSTYKGKTVSADTAPKVISPFQRR